MNKLVEMSPARLKLLIIVAPTLLLAIYFALVASDRYVSLSTVAVQRTNGDTSAVPGAALLLAGVTPSSTQDTRYLTDYILSLGMLQKLDHALHLREHYSAWRLDLPYRLRAGATQEDFLEYFRKRVDVALDDASGMLTVQVQAFDPAYAQRINRMILEESEKFVNDYSHAIAREQLNFAEGELKLAFDRLSKAKDDLLAFQTKHHLVDPTAEAQANVNITSDLQARLASREADLRNLLTFLNESAPQVQAARSEIKGIRAQIDAERLRSTAAARSESRLNALAADFQGLKLKVDFATDAYKLALTAVENARIDATRKLKTLTVIEAPSLAQSAEYPLRVYALVTLFVVCLLVYAIVRLVLATIREHQD